ncbi:hypothetical protein BCR42DRAFT_43453 [Absidia repens]|uniref:Cytochrome b561 domain-containing protein n=1 Tax=Absidia repens TaxID=90262 RepID=A0A1X2IG83_9FUNG|nr:hypothetical protein BCR42DRAFT_43453 [Absidia repens]
MVERATRNELLLIHGILMAYVWLFAVPMAIGIAVYGKIFNKNWWGKLHMWIMSVGVILPLTVAATLGFVASETIKLRTHTVLGTIVVLLAWLQIILGITNHYIFKKRARENRLPSKKPWHNLLHIWGGRFIFILAVITVPFGMKLRHTPSGLYTAYAVWVSLMMASFIGLILYGLLNSSRIRLRQQQQQQQQQEQQQQQQHDDKDNVVDESRLPAEFENKKFDGRR